MRIYRISSFAVALTLVFAALCLSWHVPTASAHGNHEMGPGSHVHGEQMNPHSPMESEKAICCEEKSHPVWNTVDKLQPVQLHLNWVFVTLAALLFSFIALLGYFAFRSLPPSRYQVSSQALVRQKIQLNQ